MRNEEPKEFCKLVTSYRARIAYYGSAKKMGVFPILQYRDDVRWERLVSDTKLAKPDGDGVSRGVSFIIARIIQTPSCFELLHLSTI